MRPIAAILIALLTIPTGVFAQATSVTQDEVWSVVQDLPAGTRVKLTLSDGAEVTGTVKEARADAVVMSKIDTSTKSFKATPAVPGTLVFSRSIVTSAAVVKMAQRYSAGDRPTNVTTVRHVVTAIGVGKRATIRTAPSGTRWGHITAIDQGEFVLHRGRTLLRGSTDERVPYAAVLSVTSGGGVSMRAQIGKWATITVLTLASLGDLI